MNQRLLRVLTLLILFSMGCLLGCNTAQSNQFTIVATTSMIGDAVKNIVKDQAKVVVLMGPGVDPHTYKATQKDVQQLLKADVVFYNGLHLEGRMGSMLESLGKQRPVYAVSNALDKKQLIMDTTFELGVDPHIWFDVHLWQKVVQYIGKQLQAHHKEAAQHYVTHTQAYLARLDSLHETVLEAMQRIPASQRVLITAHDAFGYFGRAYQVEVRGLQGISTASECGLRDVVDLVSFIVQRKLKAIFLETSVPPRPLRAVVEGCRQKKHAVAIGGYLYSDALGALDTPEGTYLGMMQTNVKTIWEALR